jgi:hypothetical protein
MGAVTQQMPEVVPLTSRTETEYRAFLQDLPDSLFYYAPVYRDFLVDLLGCRADYRLALENGRITGLLPLMLQDGPWGTVVNSLPFFGSNGGVLATTTSASRALYAEFDALAGESGIAAATIVTHPFRQVGSPPVRCDFVDQRIGQWTRLPEAGPEAEARLMASFDGAARRNVRKARSEGVTVRVDCDAVDFLERVHTENMAAMGGRAKSHDFFVRIGSHFEAGREFRIYVSERAGRLTAGLLVFLFGRTVEYFTPVVVEEERTYQPMALILHTAMMDALTEGYRWWNWGGTWSSQEGVYRFKRKWGAQDLPYKYYIRLNRRDILSRTPQALLEAYPNFYVVPFGVLESAR